MKSFADQKRDAIQKLVDIVRLRKMALATERSYVHWVSSYIDWLCKHGSDLMDSRARIEAFLTALAHRGVAASTQNQAFNAILFFYSKVRKEYVVGIEALRAKQPQRRRQALSREVTLELLDRIKDHGGYPTKMVCRLLYGCGLRVSEALNLRVKDVDMANSRLLIREAKGGKDRVGLVPCSLMPFISGQMKVARAVWEADQVSGMPVQLPGELARKYKNAQFSWQWAFLFPAHRPCEHPRTGQMVRWRMLECNVQRAVKEAAVSMGLDSLATPHIFRHCWATHVIERGALMRDVQERMGHKSIETTMGYVNPDPNRIPELV